MKRVSVTTLEKFRRYMTEASPFDTEESLIESLKGIFKGNDKTKLGTACHKIVEGEYVGHDGEVAVTVDNEIYVFTENQYQPLLDYRIAHRHMVHEVTIDKVYETSYFPIKVTARVDGMEGRIIRDLKTRFRAMSDTDYSESFQNKFYLDIMQLDESFYDVFEIKGFKGLTGSPHKSEFEVIRHEPVPSIRYLGMEQELTTLINDFLHYIHNRNFIHLLKPALNNDQAINF